MTWKTARARVVTVLEGVSITSPAVLSFAKVFSTPPAVVRDLPCAILHIPGQSPERHPSGIREDTYTLPITVLLKDGLADTAAEALDEFREAIVTAFDTNVTLKGNAISIFGPRIDAPESREYGGARFTGMEMQLEIVLETATTFAA